jgi:hypothetical protein
MSEIHILRPHKPEEVDSKGLKPCPICGAKAFISKDVVDGYYYGWSVGCPRACINDPVHKLNEEEFKKAGLIFFCLDSKEQATKLWNERCEKGVQNE